MKQAGIDRARALATVVSSDPVNVFITLSARSLNNSIIARGEEPATEKKLLQAGANAVVLPAHIGAEQISSIILFPAIAGVIQYSERRRQMELDLRTLGLEIPTVRPVKALPSAANAHQPRRWRDDPRPRRPRERSQQI